MSASSLLDQFADDAHDWEDAMDSAEVQEASDRLRSRLKSSADRKREAEHRTPWTTQGMFAAGRSWPQGMPTPSDLTETPDMTIARLIKRVNFLEAELARVRP